MTKEATTNEKLTELKSRLSESLLQGDRIACQTIIDESIRLNVRTGQIYNELIGPTLNHIGDLWHAGEVSVAHEHLATQILYELIESIYESATKMATNGMKIIVTSPEGERHWIGSKMFGNLLAIEGWDVHFLGTETPSRDLTDYAGETNSDVVALNAVFENSIPKLKEYVTSLQNLTKQPFIVIGGSKIITQKVDIPNVILVSDMIDGIAEIESHMGMGSGAISLDDMLISIGNNVLNIRKTRGLNQGVLANLAGVDRAYISLVENGKQNLTMAALIKLADALNVPVTALLPSSPTGQDF